MLYVIIFYFLCGSRSCEVKFLMNQIRFLESTVFFCVFLSPCVRSGGHVKGSRIGFAKFFRRNTTPPAGVEISPKPLGAWNFAIPICGLPLPLERSNIRRQEDKMRWFGKRISRHWLLPFVRVRGSELSQRADMVIGIRLIELIGDISP